MWDDNMTTAPPIKKPTDIQDPLGRLKTQIVSCDLKAGALLLVALLYFEH